MPLPLLAALIFAFGCFNGLRTLTPAAALCWGAHLGWFSFAHTPFAFLDHPASLIIFSLLAIGEWIGDKLPNTPSRVTTFPLISRAVFGGACGAALATLAGAGLFVGLVMGAVGAIVGSYAGFLLRRAMTRRGGLPDLPVALVEDLIAIGGSFFVASRF
ncbi:DUF4126 family protein [Acidipila sp. EB88]|uniref:DUF4126 family protein n=1 Tax=Acidipila sp. EB88 TaxID=2305226 RepID=UPI000F601E99|nr:DUF4126 family protein [Acidipila sp. EB88]RRA47336.1 DUF4126 family protein [Acidipila sp. EB88]